jgi:polyisoprenoid-binding protein YceI
MRSTRFAAALLAMPVLLAARPLAPKSHVIDKAHSEINFIADSRLLSAHGFFEKWDADVQLDPTNIPGSSVAITIDAKSINTRVTMRDNHLRSDAFFDAEKFPTITFKSVAINKTDSPKIWDIQGDLTIRGITKRVGVPAYLVFYDKGAGRFRGEFTVKRKDFGVSFDPPVNPIENDVRVQWDMSLKEPEPAKK